MSGSMIVRPFLLLCALVPSLALASVGQVTAVDGEALRTPAQGQPVKLAEGSAIELGDTLEVHSGNLAIKLADDSTLMLAEGSRLRIDDARFGQLDRHFSAKLLVGSVWAAVTHALEGGSSFEVSTDRAAAGVRGTVFRVDLEKGDQGELLTAVSVEEGKVAVQQVGAQASAAPAPALLTAGQGLRVGRALFQRFVAKFRRGAFERFVRRHRAAALLRRERRRRLFERRHR